MSDKPHAKPFRGMTEAEEAEYHYANREQYAELIEEAEPVQLDRVVSTRFNSTELDLVAAAARDAGLATSAFIREAAVAAARRHATILYVLDTDALRALRGELLRLLRAVDVQDVLQDDEPSRLAADALPPLVSHVLAAKDA